MPVNEGACLNSGYASLANFLFNRSRGIPARLSMRVRSSGTLTRSEVALHDTADQARRYADRAVKHKISEGGVLPRLISGIPPLLISGIVASLIVLAMAGPAVAATTPKPSAAPHPLPSIKLPNVPLHTEVVVEVNAKGQVVRVKSAKQSKVQSFNLQTIGNAEQMWIRHPDGTAEVGLYRIVYDYDPKTQKVARHVAIISRGGSWANDPGAATVMIGHAKQQAIEVEKANAEAQKKAQERNSKLPSLNEIRGATPSPKPPTLPPA